MKTWKLDDTGDLIFDGQNNIVEIENEEEENQSVKLLTSTHTGEWFLNILHGLNYEYFQGKNFDEERARIEMLRAFDQEERIQNVEYITFAFDRKNRKLTVDFKAIMQDGNVIEDSEVISA